jgi:two-component system CheB/CheR fusion protein
MPVFHSSTNELEQIRYALDQSAIVAITDVPGRIKYANDKFCEISKYSRGELIGQDHRILNSAYHPQAFIRELWRTIAQGHIWRGELRNRAKDGSIYWVDTTIVPFLDERGKPWQYMAIRYDISERKRQEQRLREQATLLTLGEMAAVVAHEVRNPLAGIRGGVQLLGSVFPPATDGHELIGDILARIDSLNAVVGDLLAFARLREIKAAPVDLTAFFGDLSASLRLDPAMRNVTLQLQQEPGLTINADVDQLRLVFTNLLLNAAQAMNGDGRIEIAVTTLDADHVVITVGDSGPGIPVEMRERVFEPFFTTKTRGTGLGLPTAKRIVEAHGGEIAIAAAPGTGTVVRIVLPGRVEG